MFNQLQQEEIIKGISLKLNVLTYWDETFNSKQMKQIRLGLQDGIDVTSYNDIITDQRYYKRVVYNACQMEQIRLGLKNKIYVDKFIICKFDNTPIFNADQMKQIRLGLEDRMNVEKYIEVNVFVDTKGKYDITPKYSAEEMESIRTCMFD